MFTLYLTSYLLGLQKQSPFYIFKAWWSAASAIWQKSVAQNHYFYYFIIIIQIIIFCVCVLTFAFTLSLDTQT